MIKRLLITIASGLVVLVVLAAAILLVFSTRGYFSDVITWLLVGLIGILILFTVYMVVTYSVEIVRKRETDVEDLSEKSIHSLLKTGEIPAIKDVPPARKSKFSFLFSQPKKSKKQKVAEEPMGASTSIQQIPMPEKAAPAMDTTQDLNANTSSEPQAAPAATVATITPNEEEHKKAVEAVRLQAEAAAVARRKAAAMAARSQAFPAIRTDQIPALSSDKASATSGETRPDARAHLLNTAENTPVMSASKSGSIWEQMNVRQSAAPQLDHPDAVPAAAAVVPRQVLDKSNASAVSQADLDAAAQPWQPPKQPKAWSNGGKMPGDMSAFAKPNTVQPATDAHTRAEEARAKTKIAEAKIAATRNEASVESATALAEDIKRKRSGLTPNTAQAEGEVVKRPRGRPPKPKTEEELNAPKRPRGRPPKPKTEEELNAPKRPRGRPRKTPLPTEASEEK